LIPAFVSLNVHTSDQHYAWTYRRISSRIFFLRPVESSARLPGAQMARERLPLRRHRLLGKLGRSGKLQVYRSAGIVIRAASNGNAG
jgi:hypothetical protein